MNPTVQQSVVRLTHVRERAGLAPFQSETEQLSEAGRRPRRKTGLEQNNVLLVWNKKGILKEHLLTLIAFQPNVWNTSGSTMSNRRKATSERKEHVW